MASIQLVVQLTVTDTGQTITVTLGIDPATLSDQGSMIGSVIQDALSTMPPFSMGGFE